MPEDLEKLRKEIVAIITNGWSNRERNTLWKHELEIEIRPYYPELYKFIKDMIPEED